MNFAELCAEVLVIVKRPDLAQQIESAVSAATLKLHHTDFYYKDIVESAVQFTVPHIVQDFSPRELFPQFRKIKYIRLWNGGVTGSPGIFLEPIQIENFKDGYGLDKLNVFYMAGTSLNIRCTFPVDKILMGAYMDPKLRPTAEFSSWIADEQPWAIVYEAARTMFSRIGFQEAANDMARNLAEVMAGIKLGAVDDVPFT